VSSTERALTAVHLLEADKPWLFFKLHTPFLGRKAGADALMPQQNQQLAKPKQRNAGSPYHSSQCLLVSVVDIYLTRDRTEASDETSPRKEPTPQKYKGQEASTCPKRLHVVSPSER
jgi:hypothetical protein